MSAALALDWSAAVAPLPESVFRRLASLFEARTGIVMPAAKRVLVINRLQGRLRALGLRDLSAYVDRLEDGGDPGEHDLLVELLTTHETSFFREPRHFEFLRATLRDGPGSGGPLRVWSAACSTGEEAATIALVLAEALPARPWEVVGTDVAPASVERARAGEFPVSRASTIPPATLRRWCLKGVGRSSGVFRLRDELWGRVAFRVANLLEPQPGLGTFDVVFLRNVLIYFEPARQRQILAHVLERLRPGGLLLAGHAESVREHTRALVAVDASAYRYQPGAGRERA